MLTNVLPLISFLLLCVSNLSIANSNSHVFDEPDKHQAVILQYHHVSSDTPASTSISPELFATHLALIEELGFEVLPLIDVIESIQNKQSFTQRTLAITFDDGYDSIYQAAYPLLKQHNWPFTIFVSPKAIDEQHGSTMSWAQILEMQNNGATIANHSYEHLHLLKKLEGETQEQWKTRIQKDTQLAQTRIEAELGITHKYFAYPFGEFDEHLKQLLAELGYIAFSQQSGPINHTSDFLSLSRFPASGIYANPKTLRTKLNSFAFTISDEQPEQHIRSVNEPAPTLKLTIEANNVRHYQAQCFYQGSLIETHAEKQEDKLVITTQFEGNLELGRSRYNCTAPAKNGKRYYWYSMPFITVDDDNHWVD